MRVRWVKEQQAVQLLQEHQLAHGQQALLQVAQMGTADVIGRIDISSSVRMRLGTRSVRCFSAASCSS